MYSSNYISGSYKIFFGKIYSGSLSLDKLVQEYRKENYSYLMPSGDYIKGKRADYSSNYIYESNRPAIIYETPIQNEIHESFLHPNRPVTRFVGDAMQVRREIEEAFLKTTGFKMPENIIIKFLDSKEMADKAKKLNLSGGMLLGFAVNSYPDKLVFVRKNPADVLFLTLGHEIGHVLTEQLSSVVDEEAKAYAFEFAWAKTLHKHNILGLRKSLNVNNIQPPANSRHNIAFEFVVDQVIQGKDPIKLFNELSNGKISVISRLDILLD